MNESPMAQLEPIQRNVDVRKILAPEGFKPYWDEELTDEEYHADKTAVGSGSLRKALTSPRAFYHDFFLGKQSKETNALKFGRICHLAILEGEKFKERYVVMPKFTGLTADGRPTDSANATDVKKKKAAWLAEQAPDAVICTEDERDNIISKIEAILEHPQGLDTLKDGIPERAGYFMDEATGIRMKFKPDMLRKDGSVLVDFKNSADNNFRAFGNAAFGYRYDIQLYMYAEGVKALTGKFPELIVNLTSETDFPNECAIYYYLMEDLAQAAVDYRKALDRIRSCIDSGKWPQRQKQIQRIWTPPYFINNIVADEEGNA